MMKKKIKLSILCSMLIPLLFSCAQGFDDSPGLDLSDVNNTQMKTPSDKDIIRIESKDGKTMTISWPFAFGSGGYEIKYATLDVNDQIDSLVHDYPEYDGNSIVVKIAEDTKYLFSIKTLGNAERNNTDADQTTELMFGTAYQEIFRFKPEGDTLNISNYFAENPVPDVDYPVKYVFEPGPTVYSITDTLWLKRTRVMFCAADDMMEEDDEDDEEGEEGEEEEVVRPYISLDGGCFISDGAGFKLKNLNFGYSKNKVFFGFNPRQADFDNNPKKDANGWVTTYDPVVVQSCNLDVYSFFHCGKMKDAWQTFYLKDCVFSYNTSQRFMRFESYAMAKDIVLEESTFWGKGNSSVQPFIQFNHSGRISANSLWTWSLSQTIEMRYSTFYNCAKGAQFWNSNGWNTTSGGIKNWATAVYCIFVDCSDGGVIRRIRQSTSIGLTTAYNAYWYNGAFDAEEVKSNRDESGNHFTTDPQLTDPANGDFHVRAIDQRGVTGDPRWW